MTLLQAYKANGWIKIKKGASGWYIAEAHDTVYEILKTDNNEWMISTVEGKHHDEIDDYVDHAINLADAQIKIVNLL